MEDKIWDPLRKKEVARTPEEVVRQWFIGVLSEQVGVPAHMMASEAELSYGEAGKTYRADIVVFGKHSVPTAIVECKRPETPLSKKVLDQALRYNMVLGVKWIIITNGRETYFVRGNEFVKEIPSYDDLCAD